METGIGMFLATNAAAGGTKKVGELFLGTGIKKCKEYKTQKEWKKLFVNTGEFLVKNLENAEQLFDDISDVMSKDKMKQLAVDTKDTNGYNLKAALWQELTTIMQNYDIPHDVVEFCIASFINVIIDDIEKSNPEKFKQIFLKEWREEELQHLEYVKKRLNEVAEAVTEIQQRNLDIYSMDQIELDLMQKTSNPQISLDFFEIDDEEFQLELENVLDRECIYVSGKSKEELIYCILHELRRVKDNRTALVVKNHTDWESLRIAISEKEFLNGKILIPWFYADEIVAIPGNTNIFVYGEDEYCPGKNVLTMHKRTRHTVQKQLEAAGVDSAEAYRMVQDTHGLYIPLKKKILNGSYNIVPKWADGDMKVVLPALLCGKWTETEGDISVIEFLSEITYEEFKQKMNPYTLGEDPLLVKYTVRGTTYCQLASLENAWEYLDCKVLLDGALWKSFMNLIADILIEEDPIFEYPQEERRLKKLTEKEGRFWSDDLKEGVLRSLIMKAFYKKECENQQLVDDFVSNILCRITNKKQWQSISKSFQLLCEASPKAIMQRLDDEWDNPTGLLEVFKEKPEFNLFSTYEYLNILHSIEQMLLQKEYTARAIRWLLKMTDFDITYPFSNSPMETLGKIFCAWINLIPLTVDEKIILAKEAVKKHLNGWDLIFSELPGQKKSIISNLSSPRYRNVEEPAAATYGDMNTLYKAYVDICLNNMNGLSNRWAKFIEALDKLPADIINTAFMQLKDEIPSWRDADRIIIKNMLRGEIYRHRYFASAEWAMQDDKLDLFEDMMNSIYTEHKEHEYMYLFTPNFDFPLLNPIPYDQEEDSTNVRKDNDKMIQEEIENGLSTFKKDALDVKRLIEICKDMTNSTLGVNLFKYYSDNAFDADLFAYMIGVDGNEYIAIDYANAAYCFDANTLKKVIGIAEKHGVSDKILADLYAIERIESGMEVPLIYSAPERIKRIYWSSFYVRVLDNTMARSMIEECKKYGTQQLLFRILEQVIEDFSPEEILEYMEFAKDMEIGELGRFSYDLKQLLEIIQNEFQFTDNCPRVASIEIKYSQLLETEELKCLNRCLAIEPRYYASLAELIYVKDNEEQTDITEEKKQQANNAYKILMNVRFCPGEDGGHVKLDDIKEWVEGFRAVLKAQNQESLFSYLLGKMLAYSPVGEDGFYPCEAVREIIETHGDRDLCRGYTISIFNERGVHSPTAGKAEKGIADGHKKTADHLRVIWPKTAEIYDMLSLQYNREAEFERECAEYAEF